MNLVVALLNHNFDIVDKCSGDIQIRLLRYFSNSKDWYVIRSIANHPNTPVELLQKLSEDEDYYVRDSALNQLKVRGVK